MYTWFAGGERSRIDPSVYRRESGLIQGLVCGWRELRTKTRDERKVKYEKREGRALFIPKEESVDF